jgi:glycine/D-amino acid oxidase-like deaminating enzyme
MLPATTDVLVVGAGVMGAWTALRAREAGHTVTLIDAWGTGHPRATSSDETRIMRCAYGDDRLMTTWAMRARDAWLAAGAAWGLPLLVTNGVLWFARHEGGFEDASLVMLEGLGEPVERLSVQELTARWPQISDGGDIRQALWEPNAGTLMARRGVQATVAAFQHAGGRYALAGARPGHTDRDRLLDVVDQSGRRWSAGSVVFACGPWLPKVWPELLGGRIRVTKQDVVSFGPPAGDASLRSEALPTWVDYDHAYYGFPTFDDRGFKVGPDRYGPVFDPSHGERVVDPESIRLARDYLRLRFPAMADAPVVETRVCQYERSVDGQFILDRHPDLTNVWIAGGGSGHAFKHGPMIGAYLAARLDGASDADAGGAGDDRFALTARVPRDAGRTGGDTITKSWGLF